MAELTEEEFLERHPSWNQPSFKTQDSVDKTLKASYMAMIQEIDATHVDKEVLRKAIDKLISESGNLWSQTRQDLTWAFGLLLKEVGLK